MKRPAERSTGWGLPRPAIGRGGGEVEPRPEPAADEEERAWGLPHRRVQELSQAVVVAFGAVVGARIRRQRGYSTAETEA